MRSKGAVRAADPPAAADPITAGMITSEQRPVGLVLKQQVSKLCLVVSLLKIERYTM